MEAERLQMINLLKRIFWKREPNIVSIQHMERLNVQEGECVVITLDRVISKEQHDNLLAYINGRLGKNVLIIDSGMKVGVIGLGAQ